MSRNYLLLITMLLIACNGESDGPEGVVTSVDSTGDTVVVTITGDLPVAEDRVLINEMSIAPGVDDTTLFSRVGGFEVDAGGRFWVFDHGTTSIMVFSPEGQLIRRIGRAGSGPGEFRSNNGMVILPDDRMAIFDAQNSRVSFFDTAGVFTESWHAPSGFSTSDGLVTDVSGQLYLKRPVTNPVDGEVFGRMGLVSVSNDMPAGDSLMPPGEPLPSVNYIARTEGGHVGMTTEHAPSTHWSWSRTGSFVVVNGASFEVSTKGDNGRTLIIRRVTSPIPLQGAERANAEARIRYTMERAQPGWNWNGPPIPAEKPAARGLFLARNGRIWILVAAPSDTIPSVDRRKPSEPGEPVQEYRTPTVYEVFSPAGALLGRVRFPLNVWPIEADGNVIWTQGYTIDGLPVLSRQRLSKEFPDSP